MASKAAPLPPVPGPSTPLLPSSARRQPMRQARTNPARKSAAHPKLGGGGGSSGMSGSGNRLTNGTNPHAGYPTPSAQPPAKFYPALTAFTDAVDALPSETIRHFTLLREVDAKAYGPEAVLRSLITAAQELPAPDDPYEFDPALEAMKQLDELQRRREELATPAEAILLHELEATQAAEIAAGAKTILGHAETRRSRCLQMRTQISEILVTLDEKIHVITTAYEALQKHLQRIDHAYSYVQHEIPDLYRLGSTEHWAYKEPVKKGTAAAQARAAERAQREAEERHHAAQQQRELETSNTRSETRREALLRQKAAAAAAAAQQQQAAAAAAAAASIHEEDEQASRDQNHQNHHAQPAKKLHGNSKIRKEQEALASAKRMAEHQSANGGSGLIPAAAAAAAAAATATTPLAPPQQKRRKTTNTAKETPTAEKVSAPGTATKGAVSPRAGTPASTTSKRGGKSGSGAGAGRGGRRNPGPATATAPTPAATAAAAAVAGTPAHPGQTPTSVAASSPHLGLPPSPLHALFPPIKTKKEKDPATATAVSATAAPATAVIGAVADEAPIAPPPVPAARRNSKVTGPPPGPDAFRDDRHDVIMGGTTTAAAAATADPHPHPHPHPQAPKPYTTETVEKPSGGKRRKDPQTHHSITVANNPEEMQDVEMEHPHAHGHVHGHGHAHGHGHGHGGHARKDSTDRKDDKKRKRHDDPMSATSTTAPDVPAAAAAGAAAGAGEKEKPSKSHAKARPSTSDGLQPAASSSSNSKRGGRKRADSSAAVAALVKPEEPEDDADADAEDDEDEPVYCYCQQVSYGEMVACDGESCPREWFHLDCVGLQQAPRGKAKWYCNECKENMSRVRRTGSRA